MPAHYEASALGDEDQLLYIYSVEPGTRPPTRWRCSARGRRPRTAERPATTPRRRLSRTASAPREPPAANDEQSADGSISRRGFAIATQLGGRILDRRGARPAAILGSLLGAVGFYLWAGHLHQPLASQWPWVILAGAGIGFVLTPVTTDAVNRAQLGSFAEVTGVTQTVRYFTAGVSLAVLGSVLTHQTRSNAKASLAQLHVPDAVATKIVASINTGAGTTPPRGRGASVVFAAIEGDFAQATRVVCLAMAGIMAASFLLAVRRMERGIPTEVAEAIEAEAAMNRRCDHDEGEPSVGQ